MAHHTLYNLMVSINGGDPVQGELTAYPEGWEVSVRGAFLFADTGKAVSVEARIDDENVVFGSVLAHDTGVINDEGRHYATTLLTGVGPLSRRTEPATQ